ncbi:MAG: UMP kinase [Deltaproteobacteria bacterium]|nr:UMP kinase [Deltaproteobacteria bacterium]
MSDGPRYRRVLLKLSGEALMGPLRFGIHPETIDAFAAEIAEVRALGAEVAIVIGGGNFFRGVSTVGRQFERAAADTVGMLATVMNGLIFQDALERCGIESRLMTALQMPQVAEPFIRRRALKHLAKGRVVLFETGTGHPYFSTDTAAALRALEVHADALLKGTKVDGVFSADPVTNPDAVRYDRLGYQDVIEKGLRFMDATAVALCMENRIPLHVFNVRTRGNLVRLLRGEPIGTVVE